MTIRACLNNGRIQPLEPLPADWTDGQELLVEQSEHEDDFDYNPVPPLRSHSVNAVFEPGAQILPAPFDLVED